MVFQTGGRLLDRQYSSQHGEIRRNTEIRGCAWCIRREEIAPGIRQAGIVCLLQDPPSTRLESRVVKDRRELFKPTPVSFYLIE